MRTYVITTLREAFRSPGSWLLLGLGAVAGWGGLRLAILGLGRAEQQASNVVIGTGQAFTLLATLWILGRALDEDRASGLRTAADCTLPGPAGRLVGRWAGAALAGAVMGCLLTTLLLLLTPHETLWGAHVLCLYLANMEVAVLAATWALLLSVLWPGGPGVLLGLALWFVGHLPWGTPHLADGSVGRAIALLLPGPRAPLEAVALLGPTLLGAAGLALLALALRPAEGARV